MDRYNAEQLLYHLLAQEPELDSWDYGGVDVMGQIMREADMRYNASMRRAEFVVEMPFGIWAIWQNSDCWSVRHPDGAIKIVRLKKLWNHMYLSIQAAKTKSQEPIQLLLF